MIIGALKKFFIFIRCEVGKRLFENSKNSYLLNICYVTGIVICFRYIIIEKTVFKK
jgi:hypothetical protein